MSKRGAQGSSCSFESSRKSLSHGIARKLCQKEELKAQAVALRVLGKVYLMILILEFVHYIYGECHSR
ncbi:uncharacterized protein M6B38_271195 [Iris pallida]|uniref:Uncharacterized protein n=1 Tax=Iris pallida TaxID=29817 RepID=A0AAX6EQF3_IRIPA|nr:uncharacterized protein M6B38_175885 [Iris pallida]KAJ6849115.1 uncharacterized protein M6B38_271195 [Iris pallida]